jgi:hypothetical protein
MALPILAGLIAGCGPSGEAPPAAPPDDPEVVALWDGGRVTRADLDQAVLALPAEQRQSLGGDPAFYRNLARELAVHRILLDQATLAGEAESAEQLQALRELERSAHFEQYLREQPLQAEAPSEADLRERYGRDRESYRRPERRHVLNIFRRVDDDGGAAAAIEEMRQLRARVLAGAGFASLAAETSDSETRHRHGEIGWVERGKLAPELEEIVFALPEGMPSEPIRTADGVHLFYVDTAVAAREFPFEEARGLIRQELVAERRLAAMDERVDEIGLPPDSFVPTAEELEAISSTGDPAAVVLRLGDYRLRLARVQAMVTGEAQRLGERAGDDLPEQILARVRRQEVVYQHRLAAGAELLPAIRERLARQGEQVLTDRYRRRLIERALDVDPAVIEGFYQDNRERFSSPLRLEIRRLRVPLAGEATARMAELEGLVPELDAGEVDLDELARRYGGEVEDLGRKTLVELSAIEPKIVVYASTLAAGRHSSPYLGGDGLEMLAVVDREEPAPLPFLQVRDQVRAAYLQRHGGVLYGALVDEVLDQAGFRLFEERLAPP